MTKTRLVKSKCCGLDPVFDAHNDVSHYYTLYCPGKTPDCVRSHSMMQSELQRVWNEYNTVEVAGIDIIEDPVNHPKHYTSHPSGIECIQITRHMGFNLGNAFKYIWRADLKNDAIEDLKKAIWYIQDEIEKRSKG